MGGAGERKSLSFWLMGNRDTWKKMVMVFPHTSLHFFFLALTLSVQVVSCICYCKDIKADPQTRCAVET